MCRNSGGAAEVRLPVAVTSLVTGTELAKVRRHFGVLADRSPYLFGGHPRLQRGGNSATVQLRQRNVPRPGLGVLFAEDQVHAAPKLGESHAPILPLPQRCQHDRVTASGWLRHQLRVDVAESAREVHHGDVNDSSPLSGFGDTTRQWFAESFAAPTTAQSQAWSAIGSGDHTLVVAPTGSGKTLAAFLWAIDQLNRRDDTDAAAGTSVLYISPLKALAADIERNLRAPLAGLQRIDPDAAEITVGVRTGDTPSNERRRMQNHPPDILITTPESLFLMLTSAARTTLANVKTVIVDEIHALAGNKRGSHLALSLERLEQLDCQPQRIGLSATVRPVEEVANFLGGDRPVTIVAAPQDRRLELQVEVPVADLANPPPVETEDGETTGAPSIWPHVEEAVTDQIAAHQSTLVFTNSRRLAERLTTRLNEIWTQRLPEEPVLARAHHGSVSKQRRTVIEDELKAGALRSVVATSSLELGIDMGAVDLVVQVQSPPGVAAGLQRVGRAGHQVGAVSRAVLYPTHRGDLLAAAVTAAEMTAGELEPTQVPRHPLDVLAQQIVAAVAMDEWDVDELYAVVRRAWPYRQLPSSAYEAVLDMLAGRYPSEQFASLKPRLVWDRTNNRLTGRPGAQRLAVTSGGTIPDRGHFGVFLIGDDGNSRVGELDEEMVYESRVGDVFALGSSSWRIEDITPDRVLVSPAPGQPAKLPFWHGDNVGRSAQLGQAIGEFLDKWPDTRAEAPPALAAAAATNLADYLDEQLSATGTLPGAQRVVVEQFRDELGDRRVVVHSPHGARVHAPWALILADQLQQRYGVDAQVMPADDGIVLRLPDDGSLDSLPQLADLLAVTPESVHEQLTALVAGSALFAARFRECAARSLLFPRRDPTRRAPLWQQRQRSAQLLSVAAEYDSFPVILETYRECLQDVYDLPALTALLERIRDDQVEIVEVTTTSPSPFARSLLFNYVASFLYEGDSPLAERKSAALALDEGMLTELLGTADLRELLAPDALRLVASRLQHLDDRAAGTAEQSWDVLRRIGPLREDELAERGISGEFREELASARRIFEFRLGSTSWWAVTEDAGRLRDGLGIALPPGLPEAVLATVPAAHTDLLLRYARCHGPFTTSEAAERYGLTESTTTQVIAELVARGDLLAGEFRPGDTGSEWCHPDVLRNIRRVSAAMYRDEIEPADPEQLAIFLPEWQQVAPPGGRPRRRGTDGLLDAIEQLAGVPLPASQLDAPILRSRVADYQPAMLDELTLSGEVSWWGAAALPKDGWICLAPSDQVNALLPEPQMPDHPIDVELLALLESGGAWFTQDLHDRLPHFEGIPRADVEAALWRLVWSGRVTNDTISIVRRRAQPTPRRTTSRRGRRARIVRPQPTGRWSALAPGVDPDPAHAITQAEILLERYGLVSRSTVLAERRSYAPIYRALSALEDRGRCRRGYVVAGLGGSQFALPQAVDRLRAAEPQHRVHVLAAGDPANPYGAALPWPDHPGAARPGRKAGALVVLMDGALLAYVERGGGSLLTFSDESPLLEFAATALVSTVTELSLPPLAIKKIDGGGLDHPWTAALVAAGAERTPSALRVRR